MIYAVRHGQRADDPCCNDSTSIELEFDPPLSKHGLAQAHATGKYLKEAIAKLENSSGQKKKNYHFKLTFFKMHPNSNFII